MSSSLCAIEGCGRPFYALGWCKRHYLRNYKSGRPVGGKSGRPPGDPVPNLAAVRRELGLTQRELAEMLGVNRHYIHELEKGYKRASKDLQRRLVGIAAHLRAQQRIPEERRRLAGLI